ncbi:MAG: hypothetical protein AB1649_09115 [Chloroflexota bacterium]
MHQHEHHDMFLEKVHPSGVEEWHCATCDKCVLVAWKPTFSIATREADGRYLVHRLSKDGLKVESTEIVSLSQIIQPEGSKTFSEEERLAPWLAWMEETGFEHLWEDEDQ